MSDENDKKSAWTKPPKGRAKKPKGAPKNAHVRGDRHTLARRRTQEKTNRELRDNPDIHGDAPPEVPLFNAMDLVPPPEPVAPKTGREKQGAGSAYRPEYATIAKAMCELGATDIQVARALQVSLSTMWGWQARHEDFFRAMIVGKDLPDEKVIRALYQRAVGYSYPEIEVKMVGGQPMAFHKITHIPPDVSACNSWLRSRRKEEWSPQSTLALTGDQAFLQLWQMVSTGQTVPLLEVDMPSPEEEELLAQAEQAQREARAAQINDGILEAEYEDAQT